MYAMVGHQAATAQTITLGADREGKLTGIRHDSECHFRLEDR
jgi:CO/xanthine dehydrogenase Mo-binding subunit